MRRQPFLDHASLLTWLNSLYQVHFADARAKPRYHLSNPFLPEVLAGVEEVGAEEVGLEAWATVLTVDSRYSLDHERAPVREVTKRRLCVPLNSVPPSGTIGPGARQLGNGY